MSPIHAHEIRHAERIERNRALLRSTLEVLPIPLVFVGVGAFFVLAGVGLPWWVALGGLFYGGLAIGGVVEDARRVRTA